MVDAGATVTDARLATMPLLSDVVDFDALDRLFTPSRTAIVVFYYCGVLVVVRAVGHVSISEHGAGVFVVT